MMRFMEICNNILAYGYVFVFLCMVCSFLPMRKNWFLRIIGICAIDYLATAIIFSNDLYGLFGAIAGFFLYVFIFHIGHIIEKITAVLVFCPVMIAVNYLMEETGKKIFFALTKAPASPVEDGWTYEQYLASTGIHMIFLLVRLLFWITAWWFLKKYLRQITSSLTVKMWMIVDVLMLAPFVAIATILLFMPENIWIVYPICAASIVSSFGCIYLAAYICNSVQTAYHAQELELKQAYYRDRISGEERVRSIYHDLKNHLLILEAQVGNGQAIQNSIQDLQSQIQEYENYYQTGNEYLDIIVRDKARVAQEQQIDFVAVVSFVDGAFIEPLDISTIFGNALDNAIEASEKLPVQERLITLKADRVRDMLVILVENNSLQIKERQKRAQTGGLAERKTIKKDTFAHGFGLSNIRNAVQKYAGQCSVKEEEGKFTLKIVIPVP